MNTHTTITMDEWHETYTIIDDMQTIPNIDPRYIWTLVEVNGSLVLTNGINETDAVTYLHTEEKCTSPANTKRALWVV